MAKEKELKVVEQTKSKKKDDTPKESTLYYFYSVGCGFCKKADPVVDELICTYNVDTQDGVDYNKVEGTISLHRKKHSNTLYTINALNECIKNLNNGVMDEKFMIPWENFKNMLLITNSEGLNKINTRIYKIEKIN